MYACTFTLTLSIQMSVKYRRRTLQNLPNTISLLPTDLLRAHFMLHKFGVFMMHHFHTYTKLWFTPPILSSLFSQRNWRPLAHPSSLTLFPSSFSDPFYRFFLWYITPLTNQTAGNFPLNNFSLMTGTPFRRD